MYKNSRIDLGMEYKYLGIIFKTSGIFTNAVELLCKKASKSLFCIRERPFNLKGEGGEVMFFFLKNILIPNVADFGGGKKKI